MTDRILGDTRPNDGRDWGVQCGRCGGGCIREEDGSIVCLSPPEWCKAHPLEGRQSVLPGTLEWFTHEPKKRAS